MLFWKMLNELQLLPSLGNRVTGHRWSSALCDVGWALPFVTFEDGLKWGFMAYHGHATQQ